MAEVTAARLQTPSVRAPLVGALTYKGVAIGIAACLCVGALGFANGGYFPVTWGWGSLALLTLAAIALALGVPVELEARDLIFLGAFAGLGAWVALSLLWTSTVPHTVLELERTVVYVAAALAGLLLIRKRDVDAVLIGLWFGLAVIATYALATRLFPDRLGEFDAVSIDRLSEPLGYWNALGILAGIGAVLALGLAARHGPLVRSLAAGTTVIFMLVLYFTYSRASWIAFFVALAVAIAVDRHPLQLLTTALVLAPWSAVAIGVASTSSSLTHLTATPAEAGRDGHGLAVITIGLVVAAALTILLVDWIGASVTIPSELRRIYVGTLLFLLAATLIAVFGRYGFPPTLAKKAYHSFVLTNAGGEDLNSRLFSFSGTGRSEHWHTALQQASSHPLLGGGAGSYSGYWFEHRRIPMNVQDAHNLYLETLAELGPLGLGLLLAALAVPLAAIRRARQSPLASLAAGTYVAFLLHAAVDWDWEMPAVTLTGLFCGLVLIAAARRDAEARELRSGMRFAALSGIAATAAFGAVTLLGNSAVSASSKSTDGGRFDRAESQARRAMSFLPWASEPWRKLGEAQALGGDLAAARTSFRTAISKDRRDWTLWFDLADASSGAARRKALAEAARLNPLEPRLQGASG
jgi:O-Antigen ligase